MALLAVSGSCMAQAAFSHKDSRQIRKSAQLKRADRPKMMRSFAQGTQGSPIMLPGQETVYVYDGAEWLEDSKYTYKYDTSGKTLSLVVDDGVTQTKSEYEYNADGMETSEITSVAEDGGDFMYSGKLQKEYDKVVGDFVVSSLEYAWNEGDWAIANMGRTWKRDVARDANGNVTGVLVNTYHADKFEETMRTTITYNAEGKADTWKYEELTYDGVSEPAMEEFYTLKEMEWENTDGQIVTMDLKDFYTGDNRLKRAVVIEPGDVNTGVITAEYKENGDYSYLFYYTVDKNADKYSMTYTDANGSYIEESVYYEDLNADGAVSEDEMMGGMTAKVEFDEHRNVVSEAVYEGDEMMDGMKYEYKYLPGCDYPSEQIYYVWNPDISDYEPFMKVVGTDFSDVTASVTGVEADASEEGTAVYNTQGVKLGTSAGNLPAGLYIVRSGSKAVKVVKK